MIPPFITALLPKLTVPAIVVAVVAGAWYVGYRHGSSSAEADAAAKVAVASREADLKLRQMQTQVHLSGIRLAAARLELQERQRVITKEIVREVEKPVYRECVLPADGVRLLNRARAGAEGPSSGGSDDPLSTGTVAPRGGVDG